MPTIRQVAEIIGILVSNFPGAQYGPLYYRHLERDKYLALIANKGDYGGKMQLSPPAQIGIQWWRDNAVTLKRDILRHLPSTSVRRINIGLGSCFWHSEDGGR